MGAHRDFLNQALLDQSIRVRFSPDVNKDGGYLLLRHTVRQCVNRGVVLKLYHGVFDILQKGQKWLHL